jgi:hypothetical protein
MIPDGLNLATKGRLMADLLVRQHRSDAVPSMGTFNLIHILISNPKPR